MGIEVIAVVLVVGAVGLFLVWRTVRFFVRMALLVGFIILTLFIAFSWWNRSATSTRNENTNARPSSAPRRNAPPR